MLTQWVMDNWHRWTDGPHHLGTAILFGVCMAVIFIGLIWVFTRIVVNQVIRRVFGTTKLPTPNESAAQIAAAQAAAATAIARIETSTVEQINAAMDEVGEELHEMVARIRQWANPAHVRRYDAY